MAVEISRFDYAGMYGPTEGDKVRLADTEIFISLVSSMRLRSRLKILEFRDRDFNETFFWILPRLIFSYFLDRE